MPIAEQFSMKYEVEPKTSCWVWKGAKDSWGYGVGRGPGRAWMRAHRLSYERHRGTIPDGQMVCHHCDNPPCVNPDHLYLGDQATNMADMVARGRQARLHMEGSKNPNAKLDEEMVREIRLRHQNGETNVAIGKQFGVTHQMVSLIVRGKQWSHI